MVLGEGLVLGVHEVQGVVVPGGGFEGGGAGQVGVLLVGTLERAIVGQAGFVQCCYTVLVVYTRRGGLLLGVWFGLLLGVLLRVALIPISTRVKVVLILCLITIPMIQLLINIILLIINVNDQPVLTCTALHGPVVTHPTR